VIVVFDAQCLLCNGWVQFLLRHDRKGVLRFASIQGAAGQQLLGWPWRLAWLGWVVPSGVRDPLYRLVARNRYRVFGRTEVCILPPPDHAARFLD
jgi:predicted DCC family thiol-disulfide oxidoreductase YuxK